MLPILAVYASHSAIQVVEGAYREGLEIVLFGPEERLKLYRRFPSLRFNTITCESGGCLDKLDDVHVIIPNGSLVEYVGWEALESSRIPLFGLRGLMRWESDWSSKIQLLREAGLDTPRTYETPENVDTTVIVKLPGAKGGRGYFTSNDSEVIRQKLDEYVKRGILRKTSDAVIQEYIVGVTMYAHYFYSPMLGRLELTGFDVRYESNADALARAPKHLRDKLSQSFTVVGNFPVYPREALLEHFIQAGEKFVEATKRLIPPGVIGPFCLESIVTEDLEIVFFEFSGRIVAGTNVYLLGSPYLSLYWGEPMTVGRRIAREIKMAAEENKLNEVTT